MLKSISNWRGTLDYNNKESFIHFYRYTRTNKKSIGAFAMVTELKRKRLAQIDLEHCSAYTLRYNVHGHFHCLWQWLEGKSLDCGRLSTRQGIQYFFAKGRHSLGPTATISIDLAS